MTILADRPQVLRQISVRSVMDVLLQEGATSRAALAQKTGLSKQTMSEVIRVLERAGWVREKGIVSGKLGRSAISYEVADDGGYALGIELGVSVIRMAIVSIAGTIVHERECSSDGRVGEALLSFVQKLVQQTLLQAGILPAKVMLAAVATPGVVDPKSGRLMLAANMGETGSLDILTRLSEALGCPVVMENDVNAAALGEFWKGCSAGLSTSAFVSLGTGIGLGLLINGKLVKGARGTAGEVAYLPIGADPYTDESLERGTLESVIGEQAILRRYRAAGGEAGDFDDVLRQAQDGREPALGILRETARLAGQMVLSIDAMLDPDMIVLGGPIGSHALMRAWICAEMERLTYRKLTIETSTLGRRAVLLGTVAIALNQLHNSLFSPQILSGELRLPRSG